MKKRFTDEQVVRILREAESKQESIREVCKRHNITEQTFFRWRNKFGGMDVAEAKRLKELESENAKLKRMLAEQLLVIEGLKEFTGKNDIPVRSPGCCTSPDLPGHLRAPGLPDSGAESAREQLCAAPAWQGPGAGDSTHGRNARRAALRLPPHGGMAGRGRGPECGGCGAAWVCISRASVRADGAAAATCACPVPCDPTASGATTSCTTSSWTGAC